MGPYVNFSWDIKEIVNNSFSVGSPELQYFFNERFTQQAQRVALIGELGFEATYKFKPNLMGRAAYDFMWINGWHWPRNNLLGIWIRSRNNTINTNGGIYAHGVSLSLEWYW